MWTTNLVSYLGNIIHEMSIYTINLGKFHIFIKKSYFIKNSAPNKGYYTQQFSKINRIFLVMNHKFPILATFVTLYTITNLK
jgi:hypothetical protein